MTQTISFCLCLLVSDVSAAVSPLGSEAEYSAISHLESTGPGAMGYRNTISIHQAPNMVRFESLENTEEPVLIFRYDSGIVWVILPEHEQYPGVKKYQELPLANGMGFNSHIDNLMRAYAVLDHPEKLEELDEQVVAGYTTTHYQKRDAIPWLTNEFVVTDYWISNAGLLIKVISSGPDVSSVMEMKAIHLGEQPEDLFILPPGYEKAGQVINWDKEKE